MRITVAALLKGAISVVFWAAAAGGNPAHSEGGLDTSAAQPDSSRTVEDAHLFLRDKLVRGTTKYNWVRDYQKYYTYITSYSGSGCSSTFGYRKGGRDQSTTIDWTKIEQIYGEDYFFKGSLIYGEIEGHMWQFNVVDTDERMNDRISAALNFIWDACRTSSRYKF